MKSLKTNKQKKEKRERLVCHDCGEVFYGSDRSFKKCPNCNGGVIILDNEFSSMIISLPKALSFLKSFENMSNASIIFDRRRGERRQQKIYVDDDYRISDRRQDDTVAIGWMAKKK